MSNSYCQLIVICHLLPRWHHQLFYLKELDVECRLTDNCRELEVEILALQLQNHSLRPVLCRKGLELNTVMEEMLLKNQHLLDQNVSVFNLHPIDPPLPQGDYPQGINTVNTAKSVNQSMPVLDVTRTCSLWNGNLAGLNPLWLSLRELPIPCQGIKNPLENVIRGGEEISSDHVDLAAL